MYTALPYLQIRHYFNTNVDSFFCCCFFLLLLLLFLFVCFLFLVVVFFITKHILWVLIRSIGLQMSTQNITSFFFVFFFFFFFVVFLFCCFFLSQSIYCGCVPREDSGQNLHWPRMQYFFMRTTKMRRLVWFFVVMLSHVVFHIIIYFHKRLIKSWYLS